MERREGARVSLGRTLLELYKNNPIAVPQEVRALPYRDVALRLGEFQKVTEKLQELFQMPKEDLEKEGYQTVSRSKTLALNQTPLTMLEIVDKVKEAEKDPSPIRRAPFSIVVPEAQNTPQQMFSMMLVNGYVQYLGLVNKSSVANIIYKSSINEVIRKDFPNSSLAQDLKLLAPDSNASQSDSLPRKADEEFGLVTFEEALAEGQSGAVSMPKYNTILELAVLLNNSGIYKEELRRKILDYDANSGWDAGVIVSYIGSGTPLQKEFATFFLEEGKNMYNQFSADEKEKKGYTDKVNTIFEVLNNDSLNKKFWWMFAPYLFDELRRNREVYDIPFDPIDALKRILLWAKTAERTSTGKVSIDLGLEYLNFSQHGADFYLSANPQGASHKYVRQEARWLVNNLLLQRDELDPDKTFL